MHAGSEWGWQWCLPYSAVTLLLAQFNHQLPRNLAKLGSEIAGHFRECLMGLHDVLPEFALRQRSCIDLQKRGRRFGSSRDHRQIGIEMGRGEQSCFRRIIRDNLKSSLRADRAAVSAGSPGMCCRDNCTATGQPPRAIRFLLETAQDKIRQRWTRGRCATALHPDDETQFGSRRTQFKMLCHRCQPRLGT